MVTKQPFYSTRLKTVVLQNPICTSPDGTTTLKHNMANYWGKPYCMECGFIGLVTLESIKNSL